MVFECLLCAQEEQFIGIGECNHQPICFRCIYKLRVVSKNNQCPICKTVLKLIIITDSFTPFLTLSTHPLQVGQYSDISFFSKESKRQFQLLNSVKCFVKMNGVSCSKDKAFNSLAFLKKHLKEQHNRYMCDMCLDKMTCVLEEQRLFTFRELQKHMSRGDVDGFGNITFMHPYCAFCKRHFYDEQEFKPHLNREHIICNVCDITHKYRYYKDYNSLAIHFKMSHYVCSDEDCVAKRWIAFSSANQLRMHRLQYHQRNTKKVDASQFVWFKSEEETEEVFEIKDSEGVNMEEEMLNLKKCKNKALAEADHQIDALIDIKILYNRVGDLETHLQKAFTGGEQKKKKYVQKTETNVEELKNQHIVKRICIEDLEVIRPLQVPKLPPQQFQDKVKQTLTKEAFEQYLQIRSKLSKRHLKIKDFFEAFIKILHPRQPYLILMHFIRTLNHQEQRLQGDQALTALLRSLPFRNKSIVSESKKYSDLFENVKRQIEFVIESKIRSKEISLKTPITREKQRLFQILGVVRRLKIYEMVHLKFALNFGVSQRSLEWFSAALVQSIPQFRAGLQQIPNNELLDMYVFVNFCLQAILQRINEQKRNIHEEILEDFLYERPQLIQQFGMKKEELKSLEEQVHFQAEEEERKAKAQVKGMQKNNYFSNIQFNVADKNDFPELVPNKQNKVKDTQCLQKMIEENKSKPATYEKNMNQMFPSLEGGESWVEKLQQGSKIKTQEETVRGKKGRKKDKWVEVKDLYR